MKPLSLLPVAAFTILGTILTYQSALAESLSVTCAGSSPFIENTTICETKGNFSFESEGRSTPYFVRVIAPSTHCSDVSYLIFKSGRPNAIGHTRRLRPGQSANIDIGSGYRAGNINLEIGAIGYVGGCNEGRIGSFGVQVDVIPTP
jgi:hypothetical protein